LSYIEFVGIFIVLYLLICLTVIGSGIVRFSFSTNHKDIGTNYLVLGVISALIGTS
jgi:uncharacterized membrane protein HdeD (DUF308 family)